MSSVLLWICVILCAAVALMCTWTWTWPLQFTCPDKPAAGEVQVVVARYAEDISWLQQLPFDDIVVYNKGPTLDGASLPWNVTRVIELPNVGRCDHTYIFHCHSQYDTLAPVTLFIPASVPSSLFKRAMLDRVVTALCRRRDSVFPCWPLSRPVHIEEADFELSQYKSSSWDNAAVNTETDLLPSPERPFSVWYEKQFSGAAVCRSCRLGIFAVHRRHCLRRSRAFYAHLLTYLDTHSNPEAGHYVERSWAAIFKDLPEDAYLWPRWTAPLWDFLREVVVI